MAAKTEPVIIGKKSSSKEELSLLSKEDLIDRIRQLEFHVNQLKNVIAKGNGTKPLKSKPKQRPFDWTKRHKRHVALKVSYLGWNYRGFVVQEDTNKTIEHDLFEAFITSKLIECRENSNYHRCGRTDKGVSAFSQIVSIDLRSTKTTGLGVIPAEGTVESQSDRPELDYIAILNRILPEEIRVVAWAPVEKNFSARFDCNSRTYKYFFPKGDLSLELMLKAAKKLEGTHDFRNLCKMDVGNGVVDFTRHIDSVDIIHDDQVAAYSICTFLIKSKAFLWHQIRCVMALVFLIGKGLEQPEIIDELFDVDKNPCKPQYTMASELPLNLFECSYDDIRWIYDQESMEKTLSHFQRQWAEYSVKSSMLKCMIDSICDSTDLNVDHQADFILSDYRRHIAYRPLMGRTTCSSLKDRKEYFAKRRKVDKCLTNLKNSEVEEKKDCD